MNQEIRKLEDDLIALLNGNDLPIEVKRLIVKSVYGMVTAKADEIIRMEINDEQSVFTDSMGESTVNEHGT